MRLEAGSKHPIKFRWRHGVNFPLSVQMTWSGAWIYWAERGYDGYLGL